MQRQSNYFTTLALAAALIACGGNPSREQPSRTSATPGRQPTSVPAKGTAVTGYAEVMKSKTIDGDAVVPEERATVMVFFASWCGHCRRELRVLGTLRERYADVRIIGLNAYEDFQDFSDEERLRTYLAENAPWLTEVVSADEVMRERFGGVPKIPSLFVFGPSGELVAEFRRRSGAPPTEEVLERAILLATGRP